MITPVGILGKVKPLAGAMDGGQSRQVTAQLW